LGKSKALFDTLARRILMRRLLVVLAAVALFVPARSLAADKELSGDHIATDHGHLVIHPISHATFAMQWNGKTIYVDPVGGGKLFTDIPKPDLLLVTHMHFDHFDPATIEAVIPSGEKVVVVAPKTVAEKLPASLKAKTVIKILSNGDKTEAAGFAVEAVPAYNSTPGKERFHPKARDNGYVLALGQTRVYIAGDTEDTPEMRALKGIEVAFLPMNQPYTMTVEQAANAIRSLKPKVIYPYHFRSGDGAKADMVKLKKLVGSDSIEIRVRDWYPEK
jgi:L-ascorbate metabolism protein UlaG (beta-lactamase superfamily)